MMTDQAINKEMLKPICEENALQDGMPDWNILTDETKRHYYKQAARTVIMWEAAKQGMKDG